MVKLNRYFGIREEEIRVSDHDSFDCRINCLLYADNLVIIE